MLFYLCGWENVASHYKHEARVQLSIGALGRREEQPFTERPLGVYVPSRQPVTAAPILVRGG